MAELSVVVRAVAGSNPVAHPKKNKKAAFWQPIFYLIDNPFLNKIIAVIQ